METTITPRQVGIKWGLIMGLAGTIFTAVLYGLKIQNNPVQYLSFLITIGCLVLACREFKAGNEGSMTLGQGFMTGFLACVISSVISAVFLTVWFNVIDPEFVNTMREQAVADMEKRGMEDEQIEQGMQMMGFMFNPWFFVVSALVAGPIIGAIVALIVAAVMKKEPSRDFMS
jgi:drug/metabolite transporter (DMT)-like permease